MSHHPAYTFGGLACVGGTIGYLRKGSKVSMIAGCAFGGLYIVSGYLIQNNMDYGFELATATSAVMTAAMVPRAFKTRKPVPCVLALVSAVYLAYYGKKLSEYM